MKRAAMQAEPPSESGPARYSLPARPYPSEDVLFCVDVDAESRAQMRLSGQNARSMTRLDSIKQGILFFVNAKLAINSDHRFSFSSLGTSLTWVRRKFNNQVQSAVEQVQSLAEADSSCDKADLTLLFKMATHEANKSKQQGRILRVILIYCRSSTLPTHEWPESTKNFTLDVIYLHDKPNAENCPQRVFDSLVDASEHVSEHESYILESGQGINRGLVHHLCTLLCHPEQRCLQEELDIPKPIVGKLRVKAEGTAALSDDSSLDACW
ncbi:uncharacterized protein A4U43_C02F16500 [Asparagus officinalis]|uniref:BRISC and BRCA1-A complex member 1 n=1 Tax=Asparagus officinalis TaxID=4686 RepID=A0A5P1FNS0_ASPOF|nr:uncharacterized protein LOC109831546 [Asparagus officinalis]ONK78270.1 uncharacterized protein A4U43_C02F16500 [Asparagus officinalis]